METKLIPISSIIFDAGTQTREATSDTVVADYAALMVEGKQFPPVSLVTDGVKYWLWDGFHRLFATERRDLANPAHPEAGFILAEVTSGTKLDAIRLALGANADHPLQRTLADKQRCVAICHENFPNLSAREVARMCKVSHVMVNDFRTATGTKPDKVVGKDGTVQSTNKSGGSSSTEVTVDASISARDAVSKGEMTREQLQAKLAELQAKLDKEEGMEERQRLTETVEALKSTLEANAEGVEPEKEADPELRELLDLATSRLDQVWGKRDFPELYKLDGDIDAAAEMCLNQARKNRTALKAAAKDILAGEGDEVNKEAVATIQAMATYWKRYDEAIIKLGKRS